MTQKVSVLGSLGTVHSRGSIRYAAPDRSGGSPSPFLACWGCARRHGAGRAPGHAGCQRAGGVGDVSAQHSRCRGLQALLRYGVRLGHADIRRRRTRAHDVVAAMASITGEGFPVVGQAGLQPLLARAVEDVAPHWSVNFWVPDADAIATKAAQLGGRVVVPPTTHQKPSQKERDHGGDSWYVQRGVCRSTRGPSEEPRQRRRHRLIFWAEEFIPVRSCSPPSPIGASEPSFGPAMKPSSDTECPCAH
jgi:hypothetical protein